MRAPSSVPDCPAGITVMTAWSLPNCATCVPGWRPCGSTREVASSQPLRDAVHGACLADSMRAMIAIVPSRDPPIPRPRSYRAPSSGARQPAPHTGERRWTSHGSCGTARTPRWTAQLLSSRGRLTRRSISTIRHEHKPQQMGDKLVLRLLGLLETMQYTLEQSHGVPPLSVA